jgi:aquaporin Z
MSDGEDEEVKVEAYVSELIGTFFLVLTVGFNVLQNTALAPISIGCILMAMVFATGKVSGGHFNPAVTIGVLCRGGKHSIGTERACGYIATQIFGGVLAGCVYLTILGGSFSLGPGAGYGFAAVCVVEVLFSAALVFVVLNVATTDQDEGNWYYGLAIGFTVMAAAFACGPISGCSLNPAVAWGVMLSNWLHTGSLRVSTLILYTLAPIFGSLLAVGFFKIIREAEYQTTRRKAAAAGYGSTGTLPWSDPAVTITYPSSPKSPQTLPQGSVIYR